MKLIALSGYARSGKDEVGRILVEQHGFTRVAKVDLLWEAAEKINPILRNRLRLADAVNMFGREYCKDVFSEVRLFLQRLADVVVDVTGSDPWTSAVFERAEGLGRVVLTRISWPAEAEAVKERGGSVWRIERPGFGPGNDDANETALDDWPFDATIVNDSDFDGLAQKIAMLLAML